LSHLFQNLYMVPIPDPKTDKKFQPGLKRQEIEFT
jgi:hypothetical protein